MPRLYGNEQLFREGVRSINGHRAIKLGFIGAQNARKTTRAKAVYRVLRDLGVNVGFIPEVAGTEFADRLGDSGGGFDLQAQMLERQLWHEQIKSLQYSVVICDRTAVDVLAYSTDGYNQGRMQRPHWRLIQSWVWGHVERNPYDIIYHCIPLEEPIYDDGIRSICPDFQKRMIPIFAMLADDLRRKGHRVEDFKHVTP